MSVNLYISESLQIEGLEKIVKNYDLNLVSKHPSSGSFVGFDERGFYFIEDATNLLNILHVDFLSGPMGWRLKRADHETLLKKNIRQV